MEHALAAKKIADYSNKNSKYKVVLPKIWNNAYFRDTNYDIFSFEFIINFYLGRTTYLEHLFNKL